MLKQLQTYNVDFKEKSCGFYHSCLFGAPTGWAEERGATHSLETIDGPRPAQVYKTFALIGVDEGCFGNIIWERWQISNLKQVN